MSENKIIAIAGLIISAIYGFGIMGVAQAGNTFVSGTKSFPVLILLGAIIFSVIIFLQDYKKGYTIKKLFLDKKVMKTIAMCTVIFIMYSIIFDSVGFLLSTAVMMFALLSVINNGKLKTNSIVAVIFAVASYGIFAKLLAISLPGGILHF